MKKLVVVLLFTSACSSPLSPSRVRSSITGYVRFDAFNSEHVCNTRNEDETHTLGVWNVNDGVNQIAIKFSEPTLVAANTCADIAMFLTEPDCVTEQVDDYRNMPRQDNYTMSFAANYFYNGYEHTKVTKCAATPPPPVVPPPSVPPPVVPPPVVLPPAICSADSFVSYYHEFTDTYEETEFIRVKPGFGGITAYIMSWGLPDTWAHFFLVFHTAPPLPQTRLYLTPQVLHEGENTMVVAITTPDKYPAWQMDWGCEPGPPILVTGYEFKPLDGNNGDF